MTTQQAPHTPPLWRKFLSLPHTRLGWWAVGLASLVLIAFVESTLESLAGVFELLSLATFLVGALAGGVVGSLALGAGERSLLVWGSLVPATIFFAVLTSIFHEGTFWVNGSVGVLLWAAIAFGIGYLSQQARSS